MKKILLIAAMAMISLAAAAQNITFAYVDYNEREKIHYYQFNRKSFLRI